MPIANVRAVKSIGTHGNNIVAACAAVPVAAVVPVFGWHIAALWTDPYCT